MNEEVEARNVNTTQELLGFVELTDVTTYAVHGQRFDDDDEHEPRQQINVALKRTEQSISTRVRLEHGTRDALFLADIAATYALSEPVTISEAVARDFAERVGIMAVYPYLRETISATAVRLRVDVPFLKLLLPGQIKLADPESELEAAPGDTE